MWTCQAGSENQTWIPKERSRQELLCLKTSGPCLQKPHPGTAGVDMAETVRRENIWRKAQDLAISLQETLVSFNAWSKGHEFEKEHKEQPQRW